MSKNEFSPKYSDWIARDYWTDLEAACVMSGLEPKHVIRQSALTLKFPQCKAGEKAEQCFNIVKNWKRKDVIPVIGVGLKWEVLKYINKHLLENKKLPTELLSLAKIKFLRLYKENNLSSLPDLSCLAIPLKELIIAEDKNNIPVTKNDELSREEKQNNITRKPIQHKHYKLEDLLYGKIEPVGYFKIYADKAREILAHKNKKKLEEAIICAYTLMRDYWRDSEFKRSQKCTNLVETENWQNAEILAHAYDFSRGRLDELLEKPSDIISETDRNKKLALEQIMQFSKAEYLAVFILEKIADAMGRGIMSDAAVSYAYSKILDVERKDQDGHHCIELPNQEFISIQNPELKKILRCHCDSEVLQYGANGKLKVYLNVKLDKEHVIRERTLIITMKDGEKISYPFLTADFSDRTKYQEVGNHLKQFDLELSAFLDNNGLSKDDLDCEYTIVTEFGGYEILPIDKIKELISRKEVKLCFFDIADRDKKERAHTQRYITRTNKDVNKDSPIEITIANEDLYVKRDEVLALIGEINLLLKNNLEPNRAYKREHEKTDELHENKVSNPTQTLSDENIKIIQIGSKVMQNNKHFASKSAQERANETEKKWRPALQTALYVAKEKPKKLNATEIAKAAITRLTKEKSKRTDVFIPNPYKSTFRKKISEDQAIRLLLKPSTKRKT